MADSYRISTEGYWQSQSGNGILALTNISSGKVIKIYSVGINTNTSIGPSTWLNNIFAAYRITDITSYESSAPISRMDTNATAVPSEIVSGRYGIITSSDYDNGNYFKQFTYNQNLGTANNGFAKIKGAGLLGNNSQIQYSENLSTSVPIVLAENEGIAIMPRQVRYSCYYRIDCTFIINNGSTDNVYFTTVVATPNSFDNCLFYLMNKHSTYTIKILRLNMSEMGDISTPFFMLVPIAGVNPSTITDSYRVISATPYDSQSPSLSSVAGMYADTPVQAYGVPEVYLSEASISNPKGMNYLNIKDFIGPAYQVQFAEIYTNTWTDGLLTTIACANKNRDANNLFASPHPIVLNEGDGIAIVSAAENVLSTTNMVNLTSLGSYSFNIDFTVESPTVSININVRDAVTLANIQDARVYIVADAGGPLAEGTVIVNSLTNASGNISSSFSFDGNQPIIGKVRKGTSSPLYKTSPITGTITSNGFTNTLFLIPDE